MSHFHLAQINIGYMLAPIDSELMSGFVAELDRINALADNSPGFIWRLQSENNNATDIQAYDDPLIIVNMSVWQSIEALRQYTYKSDHAAILRQRREWFARPTEAIMALWWVPAGHIPTVLEGKERLRQLQKHGSTSNAFSFKDNFMPAAGDS